MPEQRVLIVDDEKLVRWSLRKKCEEWGYAVQEAEDGSTALRLVQKDPPDVLLLDVRLPDINGMDVLDRLKQAGDAPRVIIMMTADPQVDDVKAAIKLGAYDFIGKPIDFEELSVTIENALEATRLRTEVESLRGEVRRRTGYHDVVGVSRKMTELMSFVRKVAASEATTILIQGESGTGKDLIAKAIHYQSARQDRPFVAINCSAIPETLMEAELFGHEKGAFTGATNRRVGRFEAANGGTIFLDEVGDIPPAMQAKLLRVLQERRIERVGSLESIDVDVRVIAATNKSLAQMVKNDEFREDLFYRLNVIRIELPPLRERMEDIPLLVAHFTRKYCRRSESPKEVDPDAMEALLNYSFPGNIRELENAIEFACVTTRGPTITRNNLPASVTAPVSDSPSVQVDLSKPLTQLLAELTETTERAYLQQALAKAHGNVGKCASICGLSRRSISAKLSLYGIDKVRFK